MNKEDAGIYITIFIFGLLCGAVMTLCIPRPELFTLEYLAHSVHGTSRSEVLRNFFLIIVAVFGGFFAAWRSIQTGKQAEATLKQAKAANEQIVINEKRYFSEQVAAAIKRQQEPQLAGRVAGISTLFALEYAAKSKLEKKIIIEVLCSFVCYPYQDTGGIVEENTSQPVQREVQEIMDQMFGMQSDFRGKYREDYPIKLKRAPLNEALLFGANLCFAVLYKAQLIKADLREAKLRFANLEEADLSGAKLNGADLSGAKLNGADLSGAKLNGADLSGAKLNGANLDRAVLKCAVFTNADLKGTKNLTQEQVDGIRFDLEHPPKLPEQDPLLKLPEDGKL